MKEYIQERGVIAEYRGTLKYSMVYKNSLLQLNVFRYTSYSIV
jgi:hypothetical protein